MQPTYTYDVHWEDGRTIAEYESNQRPPSVGEKIDITYHDYSVIFEVLEVTCTSVKGNQMVVLRVKPVIE